MLILSYLEIIKPKDNMIEKLYNEKVSLQKELLKQVNLVNEAEKYQKETHNFIDPVEQIKYEEKIEKEWDIER